MRLLASRVSRGLAHPAVMPGVFLASAIFVAAMWWTAASGAPFVGYDAHAYYDAADLSDPYGSTIAGGFDGQGGLYEYKYPPPLAQVLAPLRWIGMPWPAFFAAWTALLLASLAWLGRKWTVLLLLFPPVLGELWLGNLNILLGVAVVLGMRWPAAWAFVVLTKITPGVGLVWFAVRREWRSLGVALVATAAVVTVSLVLAPNLWADFFAAARTQVDATVNVPRQAVPVPLPIRMAVAVALIAWGARTDRPTVLPVAVMLTVPFLWWNAIAILVACIPLMRTPRASTAADGSTQAATERSDAASVSAVLDGAAGDAASADLPKSRRAAGSSSTSEWPG